MMKNFMTLMQFTFQFPPGGVFGRPGKGPSKNSEPSFVLTLNRGYYTPLVIPAQAGIQCANEIVNSLKNNRKTQS